MNGIGEQPLRDGFLLPFRKKLYRTGRQLDRSAAGAGFGIAHIVAAAFFRVQGSADRERMYSVPGSASMPDGNQR